MRNAYNGLRFSLVKMSRKRVSSPIQTKAMLNQMFWYPFIVSPACLTVSASRAKEKTREARIKPMTNFGKRSQMTRVVGFSAWACWPEYDQ